MKKNLIIGAFTNYNYNQLKPWIESIDSVVDGDVDKVVIVFNTDNDTLEKLNARGWIIIKAEQQKNIPIHVERFIYVYNYLQENDKYLEYDNVITTDVKDVYFQTDPFEFLNEIGDWGLVNSSESLLYKDEPWGCDNMIQAFGDYFYNQIKDWPIYNVGVLAGDAAHIKDLCMNIFLMSMNRPIPIVDQAAYNIVINAKAWRDVTFVPSEEYDAWACQAGTVADPTKIEFFRPFLLDEEPQFKDGLVLNSKGKPYVIVHQYDRVPEWKEYIQKKYNQEEESQIFHYKG